MLTRTQFSSIVALMFTSLFLSGTAFAEASGGPVKSNVTIKMPTTAANYSSPSIRSSTVIDEILVDFQKSKTFADFMNKMAIKVLPGDDIFLAKKIYASPDILKVKKMPTLTYDVGTFFLKAAKSETTIQPYEGQHVEFDINRNKVNFLVYTNPSIRWAQLTEAMVQTQKTSWISFMPVAFAAETAGTPTLSSLMTFAIVSRIARATSKLDTKVQVDSQAYSFMDMWKKSVEYKASCSSDVMLQLAKKMAEIDVSTLSCQGDVTAFDMPYNSDGGRHFTVNRKLRQFEASGSGLAKPILYQPDYSGELSYILESDDEKAIMSTAEGDASAKPVKTKKIHRHFSLRAKGLKWKPIGLTNDDAIETGEHVRELANTVLNGDICHRCATFFKHAAHILHDEMDPEEVKSASITPAPGSTDATANPVPAPTTSADPSSPPSAAQAPVPQNQAPANPAPANPAAPAVANPSAPTMDLPTVTE